MWQASLVWDYCEGKILKILFQKCQDENWICRSSTSTCIVEKKWATDSGEQSGAVGACWAHNPEVDGSKPSSARNVSFFFLFWTIQSSTNNYNSSKIACSYVHTKHHQFHSPPCAVLPLKCKNTHLYDLRTSIQYSM